MLMFWKITTFDYLSHIRRRNLILFGQKKEGIRKPRHFIWTYNHVSMTFRFKRFKSNFGQIRHRLLSELGRICQKAHQQAKTFHLSL